MTQLTVLHTEWSDGWGEQEIRIITEMKAVRERGVRVLLACREQARIRVRAEEAKIPVTVLPFRGNADIGTLISLVDLIRRQGVDIVNTHSGKDNLGRRICRQNRGSEISSHPPSVKPDQSSPAQFYQRTGGFCHHHRQHGARGHGAL